MARPHSHILRDLGFILINIVLAILMVKYNVISQVLDYSSGLGYLSIFVAGMFYSSIFTAAPATVALYEISEQTPILIVAAIGAVGALLSDLFLFTFVRNSLSDDIVRIFKKFHKSHGYRYKFLLRPYFHWLVVFMGGLIIASPLPDELGLAIMGFTKLDPKEFAIVSLFFNFLGIAIIGYLAWIS